MCFLKGVRSSPGGAGHPVRSLTKLDHPSQQTSCVSQQALSGRAGRPLINCHACSQAVVLSVLSCTTVDWYFAVTRAHDSLCPQRRFFSYGKLPDSCSHLSVSSDRENISRDLLQIWDEISIHESTSERPDPVGETSSCESMSYWEANS